MEVPLFPLNTVLFPDGRLPLRVFEPRYLDMVSECLRSDSGFGVCLIREGSETGAAAAVHAVGTFARIVDCERLPDGLLGITAEGECKLHVREFRVAPDRLLLGEVELLEAEAEALLPDEFRSLRDLLERIHDDVGPPYDFPSGSYEQAGWVGARLIEWLPLELEDKQKMLELDDPLSRLFYLRDAMTDLQSL